MFPVKRIFLWAILLILFVHAEAQNNPTPSPKPGFKLFFEKVYLHTDRDIYAAGDTLWYKAYLINAQSNTLLSSSGNLYVDLISPDAKIISSETVRLNAGLGNGDFELTDSLPTGKYHLRAYTNWMRNFGDNFIFEKDITVVAGSSSNNNVTNRASKLKPASTVKADLKTVNPAEKEPIVRFYPEGGSLIEGVSSLIAVKAENSSSKGISAKGVVLSASGDTVTRFSCDTSGMGLFALLPLKGQVYHAQVETANNKNILFDVPAALKQGLALQVKQTDTVIRAIISSNLPSVNKLNYNITVKHKGITLLRQQIQPEAQQTAFKISTTTLPEGISAITLYDEQNKPNCERLVYIHHPKTVNAIVLTDKKVYQPKEKVTVKIKLNEKASLSVAVIDAGIVSRQAADIVSYITLQSEVKGTIEQAYRYFDTTNVNRFKQLDLLLMTQGWRDFIWRRLADTAIHISYAAENGLDIQGKLTEKNSNKPLRNTSVSLFADKATGNKLFNTITDSSGNYYFTNLIQYANAPIILTSRNAKGKDAGSIIVDTANHTLPYVKAGIISDDEQTATQRYPLLVNRFIQQQKSTGPIKLKEVKIKATNYIQLRDMRATTFGYPDEILTPSPNEKSQTIRDYILSASKQARLQNEAEADYGKDPEDQVGNRIVFYAEGKISDPRLVVDGYEIPVDLGSQAAKNAMYNQYFDLPVSKAKRIIIKRALTQPRIGQSQRSFNTIGGSSNASVVIPSEPIFIIYLTLKPGAMETEHRNIAQFQLNGYYQARTFYKPTYDEKDINKADYRTTIHWEPNLTTNEKGEATFTYYNADPRTTVRIIVQGITNKGEPISAISTYTVGNINK